MDLQKLIPQEWKKMAKENYGLLGIHESNSVSCLGAYVVEENLVSFIKYFGLEKKYLVELDKALVEVNDVNNLIDGNPNDEGYTDTSILTNLSHGFTEKDGVGMYININKVLVGENKYSYAFQIFVEAKDGLVSAQASIKDLDEKDALNSALKLDYIKRTIKILFQSR